MKELNTEDAGMFKWAAAMDANRRNTNNKSLYSQAQIRKALTIKDIVDSAFSYKTLYINYRKTFIAVKAEEAIAKNMQYKAVVNQLENCGHKVVLTRQGLIVRLA